MAKTAKEKTPVMKAADAARDAYSKAKEANEKNDNATTKKALSDAKEKRDAAVVLEARERFVSIGDARTKKAVAAMAQIGKMNQPRNYKYSDADVGVIEKMLAQASKDAVAALRSAISGKSETGAETAANIFASS